MTWECFLTWWNCFHCIVWLCNWHSPHHGFFSVKNNELTVFFLFEWPCFSPMVLGMNCRRKYWTKYQLIYFKGHTQWNRRDGGVLVLYTNRKLTINEAIKASRSLFNRFFLTTHGIWRSSILTQSNCSLTIFPNVVSLSMIFFMIFWSNMRLGSLTLERGLYRKNLYCWKNPCTLRAKAGCDF